MSSPAQPMVFTLTGNLLAERTLEFERWTPGRTQRAIAETFQVGGKGINVAKMLSRLGVPNTALCFTGGAPGTECERWLQARGIRFHSFTSEAATRTGTVVRDRSGAHAETTFLGPDAAPGTKAWQACAIYLDSIADGQVLALCGSFPGWTRPEAAVLRDALARWAERGTFVVDSYGPPLAELANRPLDLLKINRDELQTLSSPDLGALPRSLRHVIVTDGARMIQVRDADGTTTTFMPPPVQEVSATGSGDVFLACVIESLYQRGTSLAEAVAFAIPHASANAAHPGIAEYPMPPPDFRINALR